jgi:hypothetical protein
MIRTRNLQPATPKTRSRKMLRNDKIIRTWEQGGWAYEMSQRPDGSYVVAAVEIDGDGWRVESGDTPKGCLDRIRMLDTDVEKLLSVPENCQEI